MIKSMTGFAEGRKEVESGILGASIRSVNHRYLDLQIRLPSSFIALEQGLRSLLQERLTRGRVELLVTVQFTQLPEVEVELNEKMIRALGSALERSRDHGLEIKEITVSDLMRVPNALVIKEASSKGDAIKDETLLAAITDLVSETLENLDGMRKQEGEYLYGDLNNRHNSIEMLIRQIDHGRPDAAEAGEVLADRTRQDGVSALLPFQIGFARHGPLHVVFSVWHDPLQHLSFDAQLFQLAYGSGEPVMAFC